MNAPHSSVLLLLLLAACFTSACTTGGCEDGTTSVSTQVCGLNGEGFLLDVCVDGAWSPGTECTGTDVCVNESARDSSEVCGLNGEGFLQEICDAGQWVATETCTGTDVCENGTTRESTNACGDAGGFLLEECASGQWQSTETCSVVCLEGATASVADTCANGADGWRTDTCVANAWVEGTCESFTLLGAGECRQANGDYGLDFSIGYNDLTPHTDGNNATHAVERCQQDCAAHGDWCVAAEVVLRADWTTPECHLVTDRALFEAAGNTLQNDMWGGEQVIDGESYQTLCAGTGDCTHTSWAGGSLYARDGYSCYTRDVDPSFCYAGQVKMQDCAALGKRQAVRCDNNTWGTPGACYSFQLPGAGECRQANGNYGLNFARYLEDLSPHAQGDNLARAKQRCLDLCVQNADWCYAAELAAPAVWTTPVCSLATDLATFEGAGNTLDNNVWGGAQRLQGLLFQTYCGGNGDCTQTNWGGGSVSPRDGYTCTIMNR